ncbi:Phosphate transporter family protein [uncultured archaeon]|nr:Phosphate transporter family protein [uncultured archaeon]
MEVILLLLILASFLFAFTIGGNDAGDVIGTLIGSQGIRFTGAAVVVVLLAFAGAVLQSHYTSQTIGSRIFEGGFSSHAKAAFAAVLTAAVFMFVITLLSLPVSSSQAIVGAAVGAGLALGAPVSWGVVGTIAFAWVVTPFISGFLAYVVYRAVLTPAINSLSFTAQSVAFRYLTLAGAMAIAYNLGANSMGNAVGPLVSAVGGYEVLAVAAAAFALGVGVFLIGGGVADTVGKRITPLSPASAFSAQVSAAAVVYGCIISGIPVSTTQTLVGGIIGVGLTKGIRTVNARMLLAIAAGWIATPLATAAIAYVFTRAISG